jgi:hypothetical protein
MGKCVLNVLVPNQLVIIARELMGEDGKKCTYPQGSSDKSKNAMGQSPKICGPSILARHMGLTGVIRSSAWLYPLQVL